MSGFLPDDIVVDILSRLPVKSLSRFRCVCKPWFKLFSNPNFVKMHHNHGVEKEKCSLMLIDNDLMYSSIDYYDSSITSYEAVEIHYPFKSKENGGVHIRGACNGLLCIDPPSNRDLICIWNPSTKEYKKIPEPRDEFPSHLDVDHGGITYGFGYDCNNDNYKVVRIMAFYAYDNNDLRVYYGSTPLIGGSEASDVIVSFDLGDERFTDVSPLVHLNDDLYITVGALGECLCIVGKSYEVGVEVWVMKDYEVRESWTKLFTIAQHSLLGTFEELTPIRSFKNGGILLNVLSRNLNDDFCYNFALVLYDPKLERARTLKISGGNWSDADTYVESLVSLNMGTYVNGQEQVDEALEKMKKLKLRKRKNKKNKKKLIYATVCVTTQNNLADQSLSFRVN
ncbi:F-box domain [Macleaya cordata]|uniref:F-box domain n=1 Tax=Macleaya cordata TaxID=56857 RepID=A0A200RDQ4_MACCD|nr:F-box domain [Macleaya cordata]